MQYIRLMAVTLSLSAFLASCMASAQTPDPSQVQVESIDYGGTGCPQGTTSVVLSPDAMALSVLYDDFLVSVGGSTGLTQDMRNCEVRVRLRVPPGWGLDFDSADFRGFVSLQPGVRAVQRVNFKVDHEPIEKEFRRTVWRGPVEENFNITGVGRDNGAPDWRGCRPNGKSKLVLKTRVMLENGAPNREGTLAVDSFDGRMIQRYRLAWKRCQR